MPSCASRFTLAAVVFAAPLAALHAQEEVREGQAATLTARRIEIYDVSGHVTMHAGTGAGVVITAHATGSDGSQLRFFVDRGADRSAFRVQYPAGVDEIAAPDGEGGTTSLRLHDDGTFGGDNGDFAGHGRGIEVGGRHGLEAFADLEIAVPRGANVVLHLVAGHATIEGVDGTIYVDTWGAAASATNIAGDWTFDTGSGDAEVHGATGTLRFDTGSGGAIATAVRGDLLDVDTGSGSADVSDVQVARCRFDTGSGGVRALGLAAPRCSVDTGSGSAHLEFTSGAIDELSIDTGSGSVDLTLPPDPSVRVTASLGSGGLDVERAGAMLEHRSQDEMVLRFGDGRGDIKIDTGSGGVTIR